MDLSQYQHCRLCPRACGVDRLAGVPGVCGETAVCRVGTVCAHFGEEPSLTGRRGSGTFFFTGCASRCFFCQNHQISTGGVGREVSIDQLEELALGLIAKGVHNLNFVTADHFTPHVAELCRRLRARGVTLPFVFNCSGYMSTDLVEALCDVVDVFLPDFKFSDPQLAARCMHDRRYPDLALEAIKTMVAAKGMLQPWDPSGDTTAQRGVLVRHLVLPGQLPNSVGVLRLLADEFGRELPLSIMSQFRPTAACFRHRSLMRELSLDDYECVCEAAELLGFECVYTQPTSGDSGFFPDFTQPEPFEGNRERRQGEGTERRQRTQRRSRRRQDQDARR